jgi:hypothetical protein
MRWNAAESGFDFPHRLRSFFSAASGPAVGSSGVTELFPKRYGGKEQKLSVLSNAVQVT